MPDIVRFVDSIVASPTVRLDLNDESSWWVKSFNAPPPRLRRAMSSNAMRDGVFVSSSQYEARTLTIELDLRSASQDANATELQKLARELDRADNFLMYQPTGATKPVFFRLFRSDMSQIENLTGPTAFRRPTIELLAEPFALGLRETLGPYTVNNDPAAGSNGHYFDVTGVIGDVAAPAILIDRTALRGAGWLATRQHGTPSALTWWSQSDTTALDADTSNPGGGPDAAMSGTGTNNYLRTTFATVATMAQRAQAGAGFSGAELPGTYRVLAVVRRSNNTAVMKARYEISWYTGPTVTIPASTARQVIDLGTVTFGGRVPSNPGAYGETSAGDGGVFRLSAERTSGAGTLDWDYAMLVPADEHLANFTTTATTSLDGVFDAATGSIYNVSAAGDPFAGDDVDSAAATAHSGSLPSLVPNQTNRIFVVYGSDSLGVRSIDKSLTGSVEVHYFPHYAFVRPSAT